MRTTTQSQISFENKVKSGTIFRKTSSINPISTLNTHQLGLKQFTVLGMNDAFVLASKNPGSIRYQTSFNLGQIVFQLRLTS